MSSRKDAHFGIEPKRPPQKAVGRVQKPTEEVKRLEVQRQAAEDYARRGVERVYREQAKNNRLNGGSEVKLSKEQIEEYHKSWQAYWYQYYKEYYSNYYDKYYGEVKSGVEDFHQESNKKLSEMFRDNKVLAEEKKRLEDPEAIRRDILNRIVEYFSRRPQLQEALTMQIHDYLEKAMEGNLGVAVVLECRHSCCSHRGIGHDSVMRTAHLTGCFYNDEKSRNEFYNLLERCKKA